MSIEETFKDWIKIIDKNLLFSTLQSIPNINNITPNKDLVFRSFTKCPLFECKVIILGQDPYPQKGIATGLAFGNNKEGDINLSPSLKVIKDSAIDYSLFHNYPIVFDNTLEDWAKQGVLLLNSALTTEVNKVGVHSLLWRPFIGSILSNYCRYTSNSVFILLGNQAQSFKSYIDCTNNLVLEDYHPSYYARENKSMPSTVFIETNKYLIKQGYKKITWSYDFYNSMYYD